jgi:hypothetical protein
MIALEFVVHQLQKLIGTELTIAEQTDDLTVERGKPWGERERLKDSGLDGTQKLHRCSSCGDVDDGSNNVRGDDQWSPSVG